MDKLQFAKLINFVATKAAADDAYLSDSDVEFLNTLTSAPPANPTLTVDNLNFMLRAMGNNQKIEAIKAYRAMTGSPLKESKDAIEYATGAIYNNNTFA
jgi:ribosomal protein L7/L12